MLGCTNGAFKKTKMSVFVASEEVYICPDAGRGPFLQAIHKSKHRIYIAAYKITDLQIIQALRQAANRNVHIKILIELEHVYKREDLSLEEQDIKDLRGVLQHKYIEIFSPPPYFIQSHYKMVLVDDRLVIISTGNLVPDLFEKNSKDRDFLVIDYNPKHIASISKMFLADISGRYVFPEVSDIIWGPEQTREVLLNMIKSAHKSIYIYQQDIQDIELSQALTQAARRGIDVQLIMNPFPFGGKEDLNVPNQVLMAEASAKVILCNKIHRIIHAKALIIDEREMYLGSCNFYTPSLDQSRELGKIIKAPRLIKKVVNIFKKDAREGRLLRMSFKN